jgi:hypothetical protein
MQWEPLPQVFQEKLMGEWGLVVNQMQAFTWAPIYQRIL